MNRIQFGLKVDLGQMERSVRVGNREKMENPGKRDSREIMEEQVGPKKDEIYANLWYKGVAGNTGEPGPQGEATTTWSKKVMEWNEIGHFVFN